MTVDDTAIEQLRGKMRLNLPEKYIPGPSLDNPDGCKPTPRQAAFLMLPHYEAFFGGAAGGGKSIALLMAALQFVEHPRYNALLLRRTYKDLSQPGALMDVAMTWLKPTDAHWDKTEKRWTFPSGATLTFGYMDTEVDKLRYQGAAYQFVGFDELTQFTEPMYTYLHSRIRRDTTGQENIPLRMRAAGNPGGPGHQWVKDRFVEPDPEDPTLKDRIFIPSSFRDNTYLDQESYERGLDMLDVVTRNQLKDGDWDIEAVGTMFQREWFDGRIVTQIPNNVRLIRKVRYWDLASTDEEKVKKEKGDADYTASVLMGLGSDGNLYVLEVSQHRLSPAQVETLVQSKAERDGRTGVAIWMEQEPGSSGVATLSHYMRHVLLGFNFRGDKPTGSKIERARGPSSACENGLVYIVQGEKTRVFLNELQAFPLGSHDDMVDAFTGAFAKITLGTRIGSTPQPRRRRTQRDMWA